MNLSLLLLFICCWIIMSLVNEISRTHLQQQEEQCVITFNILETANHFTWNKQNACFSKNKVEFVNTKPDFKARWAKWLGETDIFCSAGWAKIDNSHSVGWAAYSGWQQVKGKSGLLHYTCYGNPRRGQEAHRARKERVFTFNKKKKKNPPQISREHSGDVSCRLLQMTSPYKFGGEAQQSGA